MANSIHPGFFKFLYVSGSQVHVHHVPVRGTASETTPPTATDVGTREGMTDTAAFAAQKYANAMSEVLSTDTTITAWELYSLASPTAEPALEALGTLDTDGVVTEAGPEDTMVTVSFRTSHNGKMKVVLMDVPNSYDSVARTFNPSGTTGYDALINFLLGDENIRIGRDGGWPIQFRGTVTKESDALRKRRLF